MVGITNVIGVFGKCKDLGKLVLVRQLTAGGIYVFSAAAAKAGIDLVFLQVGHEHIHHIFFRFLKSCRIDGVVFNDIHEVGGHPAVYFDQLIGILNAVIKVFK